MSELPTISSFCGDINKPLEQAQGAARYVIREDGELVINAARPWRTLRYEDIDDPATPAALVVARRRGSGPSVLVGCQPINERGTWAIPTRADVREGDMLVVTVFTHRAQRSGRWEVIRNQRRTELGSGDVVAAAYRLLTDRVLKTSSAGSVPLDAVMERLLANVESVEATRAAHSRVVEAQTLLDQDIGAGSTRCRDDAESAFGLLLQESLCQRAESLRTKISSLEHALQVRATALGGSRGSAARRSRSTPSSTAEDAIIGVRTSWTDLLRALSEGTGAASSLEADRRTYCDADGEWRWLRETNLAPEIRAELPVLSDARTVRALRWGVNADVTGSPEATFALVVTHVPRDTEVAFDYRGVPEPTQTVSSIVRFLMATMGAASGDRPLRTTLCSPSTAAARTSRLMSATVPLVGDYRIVAHMVPTTRTSGGSTISVLVCAGNSCRPTGDDINVRSRVRVDSVAEWQFTLFAGLSVSLGVEGAFGNSTFDAVGTPLLSSQSYQLNASADLRSYFNFSLHAGVRHRRDWFLGIGTSLSDTSGAKSLAQWTLLAGWSPPRAHPFFLTVGIGFRMNPTPVDYELGNVVAVPRNAMGLAAAPALATSNEPYFVATLGIGIDLAFLGTVADDILKAIRGR